MTLIKQEFVGILWSVELWDKTHKNQVDYNYLVEVGYNGRTSQHSKTFETEAEANTYYDTIKAQLTT